MPRCIYFVFPLQSAIHIWVLYFAGILFVLLLTSYYSTLVSFRRKALVFIIFRYVSDISCHPQVLYQSEDFKYYFNLLYFNKKDLVLYYIESRNAIIGVDFK